jgi:hypothetical protein
MSNLRMCNCRYCKAGRKSKTTKKLIRSLRKANRQQTKYYLKNGLYELVENEINVPYTD